MALFARKKKSQEAMHLTGFPGHVDTCKCLYLAAEKGIQVSPDLLDITAREQDGSGFRQRSPFGKLPILAEGDLVISGAEAILPYLDIRGTGQSLTPRKAARLGEQNYWIEVGCTRVMPHVNVLLEEHVLRQMADPSAEVDQERVDRAKAEIDLAFQVADRHLEGRDYFAVEYSFAEVHWAPYLNFCEITGHGDLLEQRPRLRRWLDRLRARSNGGRRSWDALPDLDQIRGKRLRSVA